MKLKTLVIAAFTVASLHGQAKPADPYREAKAAPASPGANIPPEERGPTNISICYETFSLPLAMAAKLQRTQLPDPELYKQILAAVEKEDARQESFTVLRSRSGQKALTESHSEQIFPTEWVDSTNPASASVGTSPASASDAGKPFAAADTGPLPLIPTAFQTKNVGTSVEIEPTLGEDRSILDLRLIPQHVALVDRITYGQGLSETEMPVFEIQRINNSVTLRINQPFLLGTVSRPPISKVDPDSANRVWFAFVTGTLVTP